MKALSLVSSANPESNVADFNGCFGVGAGFNVGIFNPNVKLSLFSENFDIFEASFRLGRRLTMTWTFYKLYLLGTTTGEGATSSTQTFGSTCLLILLANWRIVLLR